MLDTQSRARHTGELEVPVPFGSDQGPPISCVKLLRVVKQASPLPTKGCSAQLVLGKRLLTLGQNPAP